MRSSSVSENEQRAAVGDVAENVQLDLLHRAQTSRRSGFFDTLHKAVQTHFFTDSTQTLTAGPVTRDLSSRAGCQRTRFSCTVIKSTSGVKHLERQLLKRHRRKSSRCRGVAAQPGLLARLGSCRMLC